MLLWYKVWGKTDTAHGTFQVHAIRVQATVSSKKGKPRRRDNVDAQDLGFQKQGVAFSNWLKKVFEDAARMTDECNATKSLD